MSIWEGNERKERKERERGKGEERIRMSGRKGGIVLEMVKVTCEL